MTSQVEILAPTFGDFIWLGLIYLPGIPLRDLECPECETSFQVEWGERPQCPECSFSGPVVESPELDLESYREKKADDEDKGHEDRDKVEPETQTEELAWTEVPEDEDPTGPDGSAASDETISEPEPASRSATETPDQKTQWGPDRSQSKPQNQAPQGSARREPEPPQSTQACPSCGAVALPDMQAGDNCPNCGHTFTAHSAPATAGAPQPASQSPKPANRQQFRSNKYCKGCGSEVHPQAEICPNCGVRLQEQVQQPTDEKSAGLAAVLSALVVGLGQLYNGQIGKGIAFFVLAIILGITIFIGIGLILVPIFWIYNVYDAYDTAKKINAGKIRP